MIVPSLLVSALVTKDENIPRNTIKVCRYVKARGDLNILPSNF